VIIKKISEYDQILEKNNPVRVNRIKQALNCQKQFLMKYGFENFNIPYQDFYDIAEQYEDQILSQLNLSQFEREIKNDNENISVFTASQEKDEFIHDDLNKTKGDKKITPKKPRIKRSIKTKN
jgi:hypothetical protein